MVQFCKVRWLWIHDVLDDMLMFQLPYLFSFVCDFIYYFTIYYKVD